VRKLSESSLTIVAPIFNEIENISLFHERIMAAIGELMASVELIFIDDGSSDGSLGVAASLAESDSRVRVLSLSRNFGHQHAVTAGLDRSVSDCTVVIDTDLQDPPEFIPDLLLAWEQGADVVHAVRGAREGESFAKKILARTFYRTLQRLTAVEMTLDAGDFRLYDRRAIEVLRELPERERFIRGLASWVGFRQVQLTYRRHARHAGSSKYPIRKSMRLAVTALTSFSIVPLQMASLLGFALSALTGSLLPILVLARILGVEGLGGQTTVLLAVLFIGGVQLFFLGVVGEYLGRMGDEIKGRPCYVVASDTMTPDGVPTSRFRIANGAQ